MNKEIKLQQKWFSQRDSATTQGPRMCDTSSHAMLLYSLKPHLAQDPSFMKGYSQFDDAFLKNWVELYGDTTDPNAQVQCLRERFKIDARFHTDLCLDDVVRQLELGYGVPLAILIHDELGNLDPNCGHWMYGVGITSDRKFLWIHDPAGELALKEGGYNGPQQYVKVNGKTVADGAYRRYSVENFSKRWLCDSGGHYVGGRTGYGTIVKGFLR